MYSFFFPELVSEPRQKSKLIYARLKRGFNDRYVWLGNDDFAKLFESWDFESNEGKFEGMLDFDQSVSYFLDKDELKEPNDLIGMNLGECGEIIDFEMRDIEWENPGE